jgi:hypothetical protein
VHEDPIERGQGGALPGRGVDEGGRGHGHDSRSRASARRR